MGDEIGSEIFATIKANLPRDCLVRVEVAEVQFERNQSTVNKRLISVAYKKPEYMKARLKHIVTKCQLIWDSSRFSTQEIFVPFRLSNRRNELVGLWDLSL